MKYLREFVASTLVGGLLIVLPVYLAVVLLLKTLKALVNLLEPIRALLPDWLPAGTLLSALVVLAVSFAVGAAVRTRAGRSIRDRAELTLTGKLPGYAVLRSLTRRMAGQGAEQAWQPALAEIEEALVPAFIVEELDDGRRTVFVPSIPTPFAGAVYILGQERVHIVDVPLTQAIKSVTRWGAGSKELVAAIRKPGPA